MISVFLREQKRYTQPELSRLLHCSRDEIVSLIRRLKEYGVLKAVNASDPQRDMSQLLDDDIAVAEVEPEDTRFYYVFTFVGVITISNRILKCYPKYILRDDAP